MKRGSTAAAGLGVVAIFIGAIVIFVLPFAFPTPPPIVQQFFTTRRFSPNSDGIKDVARVAVRLNESAVVRLSVLDADHRLVRVLIPDESLRRSPRTTPVLAPWGGRADSGRLLPDGDYTLELLARGARGKRWDTPRRITIDTTPPALGGLGVQSAAIAGTGAGECRTTVAIESRANLVLSVRRNGKVVEDRRPFTGGRIRWSWSARPGGHPVHPGIYRVVATATDQAGNRRGDSRSCWVGHIVGRPIPANARPGALIRAALSSTAGVGLAGSVPVKLQLFRRTGTPGDRRVSPIGRPVGRPVVGPVGRTRIRLPQTIRPGSLWLLATTATGTALVPLRR